MGANALKIISDAIIKDLEAIAKGEATMPPWSSPWKNGAKPHNAYSTKPYHGINTLILWITSREKGYFNPKWVTFKQAAMLGAKHDVRAHVREGEKGTPIVRWVEWQPKEFRKIATDTYVSQRTGEITDKDGATFSTMRNYHVYNINQIEGLPEDYYVDPDANAVELTDGDIKEFVFDTGASIQAGGDMACFVPSRDEIRMPFPSQFKDEENYWGVLFHELGHWTGHKDRLAREMEGHRESGPTEVYAFEELVAEITSAYLAGHFGLEAELQHVAYCHHYIKAIKSNERTIQQAAAAAQKAFDYLIPAAEEKEAAA